MRSRQSRERFAILSTMQLDLDIRETGLRAIAARTDLLEDPGAFDSALSHVSRYRRDKVAFYRFEADRRLSLLAGVLLDELLCDFGLRECDMDYVAGKEGKPAFADYGDLHFSLAHGGKMALAALSDAPVGVDVEHLQAFPYDVADPFEWTKMESVGKLLGCGVGKFIDSAAFRMPAGITVRHFELGEHLACIAARNALSMPLEDMMRG